MIGCYVRGDSFSFESVICSNPQHIERRIPMGADLYIEKIHHPLIQKYEPLFEAAVRRRDS